MQVCRRGVLLVLILLTSVIYAKADTLNIYRDTLGSAFSGGSTTVGGLTVFGLTPIGNIFDGVEGSTNPIRFLNFQLSNQNFVYNTTLNLVVNLTVETGQTFQNPLVGTVTGQVSGGAGAVNINFSNQRVDYSYQFNARQVAFSLIFPNVTFAPPTLGTEFRFYNGTIAIQTFRGSPIPEPVTLILLGTGVAGIGLKKWSGRRS